MFAHQVIEDMEFRKYYVSDTPSERYEKLCKTVAVQIKKSMQFHIGDAHDYDSFVNGFIGGICFYGDLANFVKLPFKSCWFDYTSVKGKGKDVGQWSCPKRGACAIGIKDDLFTLNLFYYVPKKESSTFGYDFNGWYMNPISYLISIGKDFSDRDDLWSISGMFPSVGEIIGISKNIAPFAHLGADEESMMKIVSEDMQEISYLNIVLLLLSCKNIGTETVNPPAKLNKSRAKKGKQPLFSYKTLVIKPTSKKQQGIPKHLWENRVHLCRGHFKTYTEENPLFGKFTGRYWWQPAVRGNKKLGIIHKDYKINTEAYMEATL